MKKETNKVVYVDDLVAAIQGLPNAPNGDSGTYDKSTLLNLVEKLPKHTMTKKKYEEI